MMKTLLIGHGDFPHGLANAAKMISGDIGFLKPISFNEKEDIYNFERKLKEEIENSNEDILVIVDLFGGSPFNIAMKLACQHKRNKVKVLAGVNLPIVLELSSLLLNNSEIDAIVSQLTAIGKEGIVEGFHQLGLYGDTE